MDLAAHLATVDLLRARDFPAQRVRAGAVESGPGFHLAVLAVSEAFWEDDGSRWAAVEDEFGAVCQALVELLAQRWGEPETLDLGPYLTRLDKGLPVLPPLDVLCGYLPEVHGWRVADRWIALGVGQWDGELPFQLVLAVAERDIV